MLAEIQNVRQIAGEPRRRWFASSLFDLIVWMDSHEAPSGFQLCYHDGVTEKALTWTAQDGYSHSNVDDGEGRSGHFKMTPIMFPDGIFQKNSIVQRLDMEMDGMDAGLRAWIRTKLMAYPDSLG